LLVKENNRLLSNEFIEVIQMDILKGQQINIEITGMNHEGQGVGKVRGFTVFVDGAMTGEVVSVEIVQVKKTYAVGLAREILRASHERALPFCPVYEKCGGCSLQHMTYRETLKFKEGVVRDNLERIGKLKNVKILPTLGMEEPFHYRNKAQFPFGMKGGRPISGLYAKKSHNIVEFLECAIQKEENDKVRRVVEAFVDEYRVPIYDEETEEGLLRHVYVRAANVTQEVMVVFVVNGKTFPRLNDLIQILTQNIPAIKSIYLNVNTKKTNIIMGDENILAYGREFIVDDIGKFKFEISPNSFFQVNPLQTEVLYGKALEYAKLTGEETVFDLYSGIGTIALFLSQKAKKVYGVEVVKEAVEDANRNKMLNGVKNVEFIEGDVQKEIPRLYEKGIKADLVVVDPPRKGCDEELLDTIIEMKPKRIVYVSCNPSTLARDLAYLERGGYKTMEVQPVDMFPWTRHVESVTLIEALNS
jgi:23S rRNA (uracil1939-C5)-methyltransferase